MRPFKVWIAECMSMQVTPEGGALAAGDSVSITVKFSPQEVEDCSRRLVATIPNLSSGLQAPNRALAASVLRPWCHFDLPPSDYITAGPPPVTLLLLLSPCQAKMSSNLIAVTVKLVAAAFMLSFLICMLICCRASLP